MIEKTIAYPATPPLTPAVMTPARDATMLDVESWRTVARSETTSARLREGAAPLRPARDPVNKGASVSVEWAGRCRACETVIWSAIAPASKSMPRHCPDCRALALAAGESVGPPIFRSWMVWRQAPPEVPGARTPTRRAAPSDRAEIGDCGVALEFTENGPAWAPEINGLHDASCDARRRRPLGEAAQRLRAASRPRQPVAARARAYRARQRGRLASMSVGKGGFLDSPRKLARGLLAVRAGAAENQGRGRCDAASRHAIQRSPGWIEEALEGRGTCDPGSSSVQIPAVREFRIPHIHQFGNI